MVKTKDTKTPGTEVMDWEDQMRQEARDIAKIERPSVNKISFQSGVMSFMDTALENNQLDCIIIASVWENVYYTEKWKADVVRPPACFALGISEKGEEPVMVAHDVVKDSPGPICATCEMFKWNSDPEGGRGKACKERRRLAVIPSPENSDEVKNSDMAVMSIPVLSVKKWANYVNKLEATFQRPPWGMLTNVSLVPDAKSQFRVKFAPIEVLESSYLPLIHARIPSAISALTIPYEMSSESQEKKETGKQKY